MSKRLAFLAAVVVGLAAPPAAGAMTIGVGFGFGPGLAMDAAGTAYIASSDANSPAGLHFCRLPRGSSGCDIFHAITAPGTTSSRAFVTVSGSRVSVWQYRYPLAGSETPGMYEFVSVDGGASFGPGRLAGTIPFFEAVQGPGDTLSGVTDANSGGGLFQNAPSGSGAATASAQLSGLDHPYRGTVGLVDAATPLTIFTSGDDQAQFRRYGGSGPLNDAASWTPAVDLGVASYPKLAGGPAGLTLLASAADKSVFARKFNGTTFGPPATIATGADAPTLDAFQDAAGRLHAVFARGDASGLNLVYAVSDDGATWRSGTVEQQSPPVGIAETRVATAPDHIGVAVYRAGNPVGEIRVDTIGPEPPVPPAAMLPPKKKPPAKADRVQDGKVKVAIKGGLGVPAGVDPAKACRGQLDATLKRGQKTVAERALELSTTCKFHTNLTLKPAKVKKAKSLNLTLRFPGNDSLGPVTAGYKIAI
jgi:hypothetical protein